MFLELTRWKVLTSVFCSSTEKVILVIFVLGPVDTCNLISVTERSIGFGNVCVTQTAAAIKAKRLRHDPKCALKFLASSKNKLRLFMSNNITKKRIPTETDCFVRM